MPDKFVIYLHPDDLTHPSWVILPADGSAMSSGFKDDPLGLSSIAEDKKVIVLVPGVDVLLTQVNFPKMNRSRLLAALPFALEDQLIGELESMHFTPGNTESSGDLPVAIVANEKMQEWLQLLQSWDIKADSFIPASLALPYAENSWSMMIMDETWTVRMGLFKGFGSDLHNLTQLLDLALSLSLQIPGSIYLYNTTNKPIHTPLNALVPLKEEMVDAKDLIEAFAKTVDLPTMNLLHGAFAVSQTKTQLNKIKKWVIYSALAFGLMLILYPSVSYFILEKRVNELDAQIAEIYKRNFPQASNIVAPKARLQEKLAKLSTGLSENRLLILLGQIGKGLKNASSIKLKRFDFRDNELTLELIALSSDDLSAFTDFLTSQGLTVNQQNASLTGSRINTMLVIH